MSAYDERPWLALYGDQAADYARRKGWSLETAERWLSPILNYDPAALPLAAE